MNIPEPPSYAIGTAETPSSAGPTLTFLGTAPAAGSRLLLRVSRLRGGPARSAGPARRLRRARAQRRGDPHRHAAGFAPPAGTGIRAIGGPRPVDPLPLRPFGRVSASWSIWYVSAADCRFPASRARRARRGILAEFHYLDDILDFHDVAPFDTVAFDGVRYTALPVTHAAGTYGYLMETERGRTFYASDTGRLPAETAERVHGCETLILDATFWGRNWNPAAHHSVQEAIEEGLELDAGTIYLTHLAMHYNTPVTLAELKAHLAPYDDRVRVAADGLKISI